MTEKMTEMQKIAEQMQAHQRELVTAALVLTAAAAGVIAYRALRTRREERARAGRSSSRGAASRKAGSNSRRGSAPRKARAKSAGGRSRANAAPGSAGNSATTH